MRLFILGLVVALLISVNAACAEPPTSVSSLPNEQLEPTSQIRAEEEYPSPSPTARRAFQEPRSRTVTYAPSNEIIANPERGFLRKDQTHNSALGETIADYEQLDLRSLQSYRSPQPRLGEENHVGDPIVDPPMSLVGRWFILNDFVSSDMISQEYLEKLQADLDTVRSAGMKIILRFAYISHINHTDPSGIAVPPFGDADKATILRHLEQLGPLLQANKDVIALVEAGFIGVWGEWALTDYFGKPWALLDSEYADRIEVLDAILEAVPVERKVVVRYVQYKQKLSDLEYDARFNSHNPLPAEFAHDGSPASRIGFHNDCFLANEIDAGTFSFDPDRLQEDRAYLEAETRYVPMGGETCQLGPPIPPGSPTEWAPDLRFLCPTALQELEVFQWTYLNVDWYRDVLDTWRTGVPPHDCFDEIASRLGYRFILLKGTFTDIVKPGSRFDIHIELSNDGFSAPINPRLVELVLRENESARLFTVLLSHDPRFWLPGGANTYILEHSICTPEDIPVGEYELLLNLPDPEPSLYGQPPYSIQLANENLWEPRTGFNRLTHTLVVTDSATMNPCSEQALLVSSRESTPYTEMPSLGSAFILPLQGDLTNVDGQVISGSFSIAGRYHGTDSHTSYLTTNVAVLPFDPQNMYEVNFDYLILEAPDEGFETLFYSPRGGSEGNWLPSTMITGRKGDSGTATLRAELTEHRDYLVVWNIIGTGAIAIDNIQITNVTTGEVIATEDAEQ